MCPKSVGYILSYMNNFSAYKLNFLLLLLLYVSTKYAIDKIIFQ